jgi:hypothetical protein
LIENWPYDPNDLQTDRAMSALIGNDGINSVRVLRSKPTSGRFESKVIVPTSGELKAGDKPTSGELKAGDRPTSGELKAGDKPTSGELKAGDKPTSG